MTNSIPYLKLCTMIQAVLVTHGKDKIKHGYLITRGRDSEFDNKHHILTEMKIVVSGKLTFERK